MRIWLLLLVDLMKCSLAQHAPANSDTFFFIQIVFFSLTRRIELTHFMHNAQFAHTQSAAVWMRSNWKIIMQLNCIFVCQWKLTNREN